MSQNPERILRELQSERGEDDADRRESFGEVDGEDVDRLRDIHGNRSSRARAIDERRRSQNVTLDPRAWTSDPGRLDYPGVDTIRPELVHARRTPGARAIDERENARVAPDAETWVSAPDRFDWPGVDRPETFGSMMDTPIPVGGGEDRGRSGVLSSLAESLFDDDMMFGSDQDVMGEGEPEPFLDVVGEGSDVEALADEFLDTSGLDEL